MANMHICVVLLLKIAIFNSVESSIPCPPLPSFPSVIVSCESPTDNKKIPCLGPISGGVPRRTIANYMCEGSPTFSENLLVCKCRGKWKGMAEFQNYSSACSTLQTSFSLNGPPELNLTKEQIQTLDGNSSTSENQTDYKEDALAYHNLYRKMHGASPLVLNPKLSASAQAWAEHEVSDHELVSEKPSPNRTYISNMYSLTGVSKFDPKAAAKLAVARWYKSGDNYDYSIPVANAFSSMIWNSTTDLGVGIATNGDYVVVICNYFPPGNVYIVDGNDSLTLFRKNVFPLLNGTTHSSKLY